MTFSLDARDTIAALASAPGGGARGILRLSGPRVVAVAAKVFRPLPDQPSLDQVRRCRRIAGELSLGELLGDVPTDLLLWPGARSYTRQPTAEFHTLGSPPILEEGLAALCAAGARLARPGEFTLRAFLAGRIDLTQAEAVLGVIDARDQRELRAALAQLAGGLARPLAQLQGQLLDLLAHLEAGLDFVEEDIEFISSRELARQLDGATARIDALAAQMRERAVAAHLPRVVLCGEPNVGKSSLFNALCGQSAALVSEVAGTTRDYVTARVRFGQAEVELVDTAGLELDCAAGTMGGAAQAMTQAQTEQAQVLLVCLDLSRPPTPWERRQLAAEDGPDRILVFTKADSPAGADVFRQARGIFTSSRTGVGLDELKAAVLCAVGSQGEESAVVAGTAARCRESLLLASASLRRARQAAELGEEFVAAEIRSALDELGRVLGTVYTEDVLDRIFSRFCIGK
jgi:tRNA modification GTPase